MTPGYRFEVVGGKWDGQPGFYWRDQVDHDPPPEVIYIGVCPGGGECATPSGCMSIGGGVEHPAWWLPEEERVPGCARYRRRKLVDAEPGEEWGTAVYAVGGPTALGEASTWAGRHDPVYA